MANVNIPIYPGSCSFFPGDTPMGYYDNDDKFQCDAESFANWAAQRLGFPIMDVELSPSQLFACYEEAITEYSSYIATYSTRDNMLQLLGMATSSIKDVSSNYITPSLRGIFKVSKQYGSEVGSGGNLTWYTGSIMTSPDKQVYDLIMDSVIETGSFQTDTFVIRRVYHYDTPAIASYAGSLGSSIYLSNEFGWGQAAIASDYLTMPLYENVLRAQAIEINSQIRRSAYSVQITNNRFRILPIPTDSFRVWFAYTLDDKPTLDSGKDTSKISNHSNIPNTTIIYSSINEMGARWVRRYALALAKETLGYIRGKYNTIPAPGTNTQLNSSDLIQSSNDDKSKLVEELNSILDQLSRQSLLERSKQEADNLSQQMAKIPLKIYVG